MRFARMLAASAMVTCANDPTASLNREFTIAVGETVSVAGADLSLTFIRTVQDSRCPSDVQCVWAGNAEIELQAQSGGQTRTFSLNTTDGAREFVVNNHRISLTDLTPYPVSTTPIPAGSYRAKLTVTRPGSVCTEEARPALMVAVVDSLNAGVTTFTGVSIVARDGMYEDSVSVPVYPGLPYDGPVALAYERAGTYTVTVRADGYLPWTRAGIVVTADQCHVATVSITARLKK